MTYGPPPGPTPPYASAAALDRPARSRLARRTTSMAPGPGAMAGGPDRLARRSSCDAEPLLSVELLEALDFGKAQALGQPNRGFVGGLGTQYDGLAGQNLRHPLQRSAYRLSPLVATPDLREERVADVDFATAAARPAPGWVASVDGDGAAEAVLGLDGKVSTYLPVTSGTAASRSDRDRGPSR